MQLLQVGNDAVSIRGGIPQAIFDVRKALAGSIISFTDPALPAEPATGVIHVPQSSSPAGRLYGWAAPARRRAVEGLFERCDVVMIHGLFRFHYQWAARLAQRRRRPYFIVPHGALDPHVFSYRAPQKQAWWHAIGRPAMRRAAGVIFTTRRERDKAVGRLPGVPAHVVSLPVEVPPTPPRGAREQARRALGIPPTNRVLLFLGRLHEYKRVPALIQAFNRADVPAMHLVIAGPDGPALGREDCARLVAEPLRARAHFTGPVFGDAKRDLFAAADAFVSVSARENFGYALCEALAAGLPAIVGPGNDIAPEFRDAGCAWHVADDAALVAAMRELAAVPASTLAAMGVNGRRWAGQHLSPGAFRDVLAQLCIGGQDT